VNCGHCLDNDIIEEVATLARVLHSIEITCAYKLTSFHPLLCAEGLREMTVRDCHEAVVPYEPEVRRHWGAQEILKTLDLSHTMNLVGQRRNATKRGYWGRQRLDTFSSLISSCKRLRVFRFASANEHQFNRAMQDAIASLAPLRRLTLVNASKCSTMPISFLESSNSAKTLYA